MDCIISTAKKLHLWNACPCRPVDALGFQWFSCNCIIWWRTFGSYDGEGPIVRNHASWEDSGRRDSVMVKVWHLKCWLGGWSWIYTSDEALMKHWWWWWLMMCFHDASIAVVTLKTCEHMWLFHKGVVYGLILIEEDKTEMAEYHFLCINLCMVPFESSIPMITGAFACVFTILGT